MDPVETAKVKDTYGPDVKVYWNLHPPVLRDHGMKSKLRLGAWFTPAFRMLRLMRGLRGTRLDPFGRTEVRRVERELRDAYASALGAVAQELTAGNIAPLPPWRSCPTVCGATSSSSSTAEPRSWPDWRKPRATSGRSRHALDRAGRIVEFGDDKV